MFVSSKRLLTWLVPRLIVFSAALHLSVVFRGDICQAVINLKMLAGTISCSYYV